MGKQNAFLRLMPDCALTRKFASGLQIRMMRRYELDDAAVAEGESSAEAKQRITAACMKKWKKKGQQINRLIEAQINKIPAYQERTDLEAVRNDMLFCFFAYGFLPNEYYPYQLEHKSREERESFISEKLRIVFRCRMNDILAADQFKDKAKTYQQYRKFFRRDAIAIETASDLEAFRSFVTKHPVFVKKIVFESQGNSVELVDLNQTAEDADALFQKYIKIGKHILEEPIRQSSALSAFNASSVNTVRLISLNTKSGIVFPYCCLRTGRPGCFVDNGGAGGIMAGVDAMTGQIYTDGMDEIGGLYPEHPGTGTVFRGSQLPDWEALLQICREAAQIVPEIKYIGWDFAHTDAGWTIVEGNECCQLIAKQMLDGKGLRSTFETIMQDMDLIV